MFSVKLIASLAMMVSAVAAQGDPEALVPQNAGKPTKSWTQWTPKPTYALEDLPDQYMGGSNRVPNQTETQSGWNRCARNKWNQQSKCQTAWLNSLEDWCIWGPPDGGDIGSTERVAVAYCTTNKHGTRLIPDGTIKGAHFLQTANYVQISGVGDFTTIGIPDGRFTSARLLVGPLHADHEQQVTLAARWTLTGQMISATQSVESCSLRRTLLPMASHGLFRNGLISCLM